MGRRRSRGVGWIWLGLAGIGGVAVGSFLAQMFLAADPDDANWYMERRFDFGRYGSASSITREGWRDEETVTWMDASTASLAIPVDRESDRFVVVLRGVLPKGATAASFDLYADKTLLQTWQPDPESKSFGRIFKVPRGAIRSQTVPISLRSDGDSKLGLTSLELLENNEIGSYKGTVDKCGRDSVQGWAVAEGMASHVTVLVDDRSAKGQLVAMQRTDLASDQMPVDAGFKFTFAEPLAPGAVIKVLQANGKRVNRSPCTVK